MRKRVKEFLEDLNKNTLLKTIFQLYYKDKLDVISRWSKNETLNKIIGKIVPLRILNHIAYKKVINRYGKVYDDLMKIYPIDTSYAHVILDKLYVYNGESEIITSMHNIKDIMQFKDDPDIESVHDITILNYDELNWIYNKHIIVGYGYGYEVEEWANVLGWSIILSDNDLMYQVAASILYEMTFYGYNENKVEEFRQQLRDEDDKFCKYIKRKHELDLDINTMEEDYDALDKEFEYSKINLPPIELSDEEQFNIKLDGARMKLSEYYSVKNAYEVFLNKKQ